KCQPIFKNTLDPSVMFFMNSSPILSHVDIQVVLPTPERAFTTLITSGMSDRPMTTPKGQESRAYTELVLSLLQDWPLDEDSLRDERFYWPIRLLKTLARFPHEYKTWIFAKNTIP